MKLKYKKKIVLQKIIFSIFMLVRSVCVAKETTGGRYKIPTPKIIKLSPDGFRLSIPHDSGIKNVIFNGKINKEIFGLENGDLHAVVDRPVGNEWIFENDKIQLHTKDVLYFSLLVKHNNFIYFLDNHKFKYPDDFFVQEISCKSTITIVNNVPVKCSGNVIFEENFSTDISEKWTQDVRMPYDLEDAEFVLYDRDSRTSNVTNGNLFIFPKPYIPPIDNRIHIPENECTYIFNRKSECQRSTGYHRVLPPVVSSRFRSYKTFSFKYGRVEIRAKLPKGDWIYPQLYLVPVDPHKYGNKSFVNGQMHIASIRGNENLKKDNLNIDGRYLHAGVSIEPRERFNEVGKKSDEHWGDNFHTYSLTWTNESIIFAVDNQQYLTEYGGYKDIVTLKNSDHWQNGNSMTPFDQEFYIVMGVGVGGMFEFPENCQSNGDRKPWENLSPKAELFFAADSEKWKSTWNQRDAGLIVDYVKVYSI